MEGARTCTFLSLSLTVGKILHFGCHSFRAKLPSLGGEENPHANHAKLGLDSKQEHSWDMFKIGQTALHLKVDIYSSVDFRNYGKER